MQATRHMGVCRNVANRTAADKQIPKPVPTDAEVEQAIKARFAQSRKILDIREEYYNDRFGNFFLLNKFRKCIIWRNTMVINFVKR